MGNRTGTYVAFDGLGESEPSKSDFKYYATLLAWSENKNIDFRLTNSHEKTYSVRDDSLRETLKRRICERLSMSKNMLIVLTSQTRRVGSMLSYEIRKAIDCYELPLIIAYPEYQLVLDVEKARNLWPDVLKQRIDNGIARAIHIAFKKAPIMSAISQFSVRDNGLQTGKHYYSLEAYKSWGLC